MKGFDYEFDKWFPSLLSKPISHIESYDKSQSYEMDKGHIFLLDNRKYAFVRESGCSCYTSEDAEISICENLVDAREKFLKSKNNIYD